MSGTVNDFKMVVVSGQVKITPNKKSDATNRFSDIENLSCKKSLESSCICMHLFETVLAYHTVSNPTPTSDF